MLHKICHLSELEERIPFTVKIEDKTVGVIKEQNQLYAYENNCPHFGGPVCLGGVYGKVELELNEDQMVQKEYVSEDKIHLICPWHGLEFDLKTGTCVFDSQLKLNKYEVTVEDDQVFVKFD